MGRQKQFQRAKLRTVDTLRYNTRRARLISFVNPGRIPLVIIEVQIGKCLEEDDIVMSIEGVIL